MKKRRNQLILSLLIKTNPYNDKYYIDSKWSDLTEENEEDTALANYIKSLKKKNWWEIFPKK